MPARDVWSAIVQTAINLDSAAVVSGLSSKMTAQEQAFELGRAWEATPKNPNANLCFRLSTPDQKVDTFRIGPHTPTMKTEDVHLVHRLWLNITQEPGMDKLHHHDLLTEALTRFARDYSGPGHEEILAELRKAGQSAVTTRPVGRTEGTEPVVQPEPPRVPPAKSPEFTNSDCY